MTRSPICAALVLAWCCGCGGEERAPQLATSGDETIGGGSSGSAGSGPGTGGNAGATLYERCAALRPLDPAEVYLLGTLTPGLSGRLALARWSDPNAALVGFEDSARDGVIRPTDGALITENIFTLYGMQEDACVSSRELPYVEEPLANDELLPRPPTCGTGSTGFLIAPAGAPAFQCTGGVWQDADGQLLYDGTEGEDRVFSYDGERLLTDIGVFDIARQTMYRFVDRPESARTIAAGRVQAPGFWIATFDEEVRQPQLWLVDAQGNLQLVGAYPEPPEGSRFTAFYGKLDAAGALFQTGFEMGAPGSMVETKDVILRRSLAGQFDVVYSETPDMVVQLHASDLVTGP